MKRCCFRTASERAPLHACISAQCKVQVWGYLGAEKGKEALSPNTTALPDPAVNGTGETYRNYDTNTLTMLLSGRDRPVDAGWYWNQQVSVISASCPPEGCPSPGVVMAERDATIR